MLETHGDWIDKDRVVGLGASYGGFTSNWLNGNAPRGLFKALEGRPPLPSCEWRSLPYLALP